MISRSDAGGPPPGALVILRDQPGNGGNKQDNWRRQCDCDDYNGGNNQADQKYHCRPDPLHLRFRLRLLVFVALLIRPDNRIAQTNRQTPLQFFTPIIKANAAPCVHR